MKSIYKLKKENAWLTDPLLPPNEYKPRDIAYDVIKNSNAIRAQIIKEWREQFKSIGKKVTVWKFSTYGD